MDFPKEEDLRFRVLAPYLAALQIGPDRISLEHSFQIRYAHHDLLIGSQDSQRVAGGRLDILVKSYDGEPLLVLELKRVDLDLTDDDRDQGISYARLLHPMAPFVVVTNGRDARIYDTVTRELVDEEMLAVRGNARANGSAWISVADISLRYEAMQMFLGYSAQNLRLFAAAQRVARMRHLRAEKSESPRKYIPEAWISRDKLNHELEAFLGSSAPCFALCGASGTGKSTELCALAERLSEKHVVFFFDSAQLARTPLEEIADEFGWHFSEQLTAASLLTRLQQIASRTQEQIILLFDAIDEYPIMNSGRLFSDFVRRLTGVPMIRLIVSLKTEAWSLFSEIGGAPSSLSDLVFRPIRSNSDDEQRRNSPSFTLDRFTLAEAETAIVRYREFFNFWSTVKQEDREVLRDPLLLRLVAETNANTSAESRASVNETDVFRRYVNQKISRIDDPARRSRMRIELRAIAEILVDLANTMPSPSPPSLPWRVELRDRWRRELINTKPPLIQVPDHRIEAAVGPGTLPTGWDAVLQGLLVRSTDADGREHFHFAYDRVRDYVVSAFALRLDQLSRDEFRSGIHSWIENPIAREALRQYVGTAPEEHIAQFVQFAEERLTELVRTFEEIRCRFGRLLHDALEPGESTATGVFSLASNGFWGFGFIGRRAGEPEIIRCNELRAFQRALGGPPDPIASRVGSTLFGGQFSVVFANPRRLAAAWVLMLLDRAIEARALDFSHSLTLSLEALFAALSDSGVRKSLGFPRRDENTSYAAYTMPLDLIPLDLSELREKTEVILGTEYYFIRREVAKHNAIDAQTPIETLIDSAALHPAALLSHDAISRGMKFAKLYPQIRKEWRNIDLALHALGNTRMLNSYYLPLPDTDERGWQYFEGAYSDEQLRRLIEAVFDATAQEYTPFVMSNFGAVCNVFNHAKQGSFRAIVHYVRPPLDEHVDLSGGHTTYTLVPGAGGAEVSISPEPDPFVRFGIDDCIESRDGPVEPIDSVTTTGFGMIIRPPVGGTGTFSHTPVLEFLYKLLRRDLEALSPEDLLGPK